MPVTLFFIALMLHFVPLDYISQGLTERERPKRAYPSALTSRTNKHKTQQGGVLSIYLQRNRKIKFSLINIKIQTALLRLPADDQRNIIFSVK